MIQKLVEGLLFSPLLAVVTLGTAMAYRARRREGDPIPLRIGLGGLGFIVLLTSYPFLGLLSAPLHLWVPPNTTDRADAVVVLGSDATPFGAPTAGSSERAHTGSLLFLGGRAPRMVLTGASGTDSLAGARAMRIIARGMGVPDSSIEILPGFNTHEEALSVRRHMADPPVRRILLVTNRIHIPRAAAVFRKQGFQTIPYVVPYRVASWQNFLSWGNISRVQGVCHEYLGMVYYWLRGWIG